ncbi:MAG: alpha/beta hydrolase [Rhodobacteraceae bacterium]|nr:alpha/beta hydrolase [Paracoccaceae bacterium]
MAREHAFLHTSGDDTIAYNRYEGTGPGVVFLHGLNSDRGGTKAMALEDHCRERGLAFVRFDMFGHGQSSGRFPDGGITRWTADTLAILDQVTQGPQILIGSSMGGWVMLRAALERRERIAGLMGIAAAPDFTEDLMWASFTADQRAAMSRQGYIDLPSDYADGPYRISHHLIEDGRKNLLLRAAIPLTCPIRLVHGQRDASVPWSTAQKIADSVAADDVEILYIKDGDHRLSRPQDLARLCETLDTLIARVSVP